MRSYRYGSGEALLRQVQAAVIASRADLYEQRRLARALTALLSSNASVEAKQYACRELIYIAGPEQTPDLVALLDDEQLANYALMALARNPSRRVDSALVAKLGRLSGRTWLEVADTLGDRRCEAAIPALRAALAGGRPEGALTAARSLGKIGSPKAVRALESAYPTARGDRRAALGESLLAAARWCGRIGRPARASAICAFLASRPASPMLEADLLRTRVMTVGRAHAPALLVSALRADGSRKQSVALDLARTVRGTGVTAGLCSTLPSLPPHGKALLLAALGDRGDRHAVPAAEQLCGSGDGAVRIAALQALGALGGPHDVHLLLERAAAGSEAEREAARGALERIPDAAVDARLLAALSDQPDSLRIEAIGALGQRGVDATSQLLPLLAEQGVRSAALDEIRGNARLQDVPALLDAIMTGPADARDALTDAACEVAGRGDTEQARTGAALARLAQARTAEERIALLTVLARVGGGQALNALRRSLAAPQTEAVERSADLRLLADWQTDDPMGDLAAAAKTAPDPADRTVALRGWLRMVSLDESRPPAKALALYEETAPLCKTAEDRRRLLAGLAKVGSIEALRAVSAYLRDPEVRPEAEAAAAQIGAITIGAYREETQSVLEPIAETGAADAVRAEALATLQASRRYGDFITAWEVSPAYERAGADFRRLFDVPFPPEQPALAVSVPWRLMPVSASAETPWLLDLLAMWGGEQRVAYLRTAVWSDTARTLILKLGSDDGVKAWWNGSVVVADNTARAVAPDQEHANITLNAGWNMLLLKVTQNDQGWGACARLASPDGSPVRGLRFAIPSTMH